MKLHLFLIGFIILTAIKELHIVDLSWVVVLAPLALVLPVLIAEVIIILVSYFSSNNRD